jgi:hypothetical protein
MLALQSSANIDEIEREAEKMGKKAPLPKDL